MLKKLSSKYQLYVCGNFLSKPWFWKKLLFPDSLLGLLFTHKLKLLELSSC